MSQVADEFVVAEDELLIDEIAKCPEIYDPQNDGYRCMHVKDKQWEVIGAKLNKTIDQCKRRWKNHRDNYFKQKKLRQRSGRARRQNPTMERLNFLEHIEAKMRAPNKNRQKQDSLSDTQADSLILEIDSNHVSTYRLGSDSEASFEPDVHQLRYITNGNRVTVNDLCPAQQFPEVSESQDPLNQSSEVLLELLKKRDQENSQLLSALVTLQNQRKDPDELDLFFKCVSKTIRKLPPHVICDVKTKIFSLVSQQEMKMLQETARPGSSMSVTSDTGDAS